MDLRLRSNAASREMNQSGCCRNLFTPPWLRKFTDLAFDKAAESRWQESRPAEADNIDVGPATETDFQGDFMEAPGNPF